MHELSIAEALLEQVRRHTPPDSRPSLVRVEAGPLQAIDPEALRLAWRALTRETDLADTRLHFRALPWNLSCPRCARTWTAHEPYAPCPDCGSDSAAPEGSGDIRLISLEVVPCDSSDSFTFTRRSHHACSRH